MNQRRSARSERRALRAARRQELDGSGPVPDDREPPANPGARGALGLFGEVLLVGVLVAASSLPLVTLPAALAAGVRHLRRYVAAHDTRLALFAGDLRRALPGGALLGVGALLLSVLLLFDIALARSGALPGGALVEAVGWGGLAALGVALLAAAGLWLPEPGWPAALRAVPASVAADPAGTMYLAATLAFVVVVTWALPPLLVPALGCAALAVVAIPARRRRDRASNR